MVNLHWICLELTFILKLIHVHVLYVSYILKIKYIEDKKREVFLVLPQMQYIIEHVHIQQPRFVDLIQLCSFNWILYTLWGCEWSVDI